MTTSTETTTACPSWCVRDIEDVGCGIWHYAAPVTVQMSRDQGGLQLGAPAVLVLHLSYLDLHEPLLPDEYTTPEIRIDGSDGSGSLVQLDLSVEDVEAVTGEMLKLARAAEERPMTAALMTCPHWCELPSPHAGEPHSVRLTEDARLGVDFVVQEDGDVEVQLWVDGNCAEINPRTPPFSPDDLEAMSATLTDAASKLRELQQCPA